MKMWRTGLFMPLIVVAFCGAFAAAAVATSGLEAINDDGIVNLIKEDEFVIVLFSKPDCVECDGLETHLFNLRTEFKEKLEARVVKAINSQLVRLYSPTKEPAIVFFRHGVPLLYEGPANEDEIFMRFEENKVPVVKELSDETFEHLTQASTGATTGDWFIMFYNRECIECQRLSAVWEAVAAATRNRLNVARIDKDTTGVSTAKRFNIQKAPEFIFIRQGNYYRYEIPKYDVKSFASFAMEWFKNARAEKVTVAPSPFDDLVASSVRFIKKIETANVVAAIQEQPIALGVAAVSGLLLLALLVKLCCFSSSQKAADKNKSGKNKTKKDK